MILVALGSNLSGPYGAPKDNVAAALDHMRTQGLEVRAVSRFRATAPVPFDPDQDWFCNAVAEIRTALEAHEVLNALLDIEKQFGRVRSVPNAARTLDLDLIDYHGRVVEDADLILPHPRLQDRAFVLYPLRDVVPDWAHPVTARSVDELIVDLPGDQGIELMDKEDFPA